MRSPPSTTFDNISRSLLIGHFRGTFVVPDDKACEHPPSVHFRSSEPTFDTCSTQDYPHGLKIRVPKRYLRLVYHASSGNFSADLTTELGNVPDVSRLAPLRVAQDIADRTADGLDRYSRWGENRRERVRSRHMRFYLKFSGRCFSVLRRKNCGNG